MNANATNGSPHILVVRLGAMGDIIHTLPAVASLKHSFPRSRLTWAVEPRWIDLLDANPFLDAIVPITRRGLAGIFASWKRLRALRAGIAIDFQGLLKSAVTAALARPDQIFGFHRSQLRERAAALFYSTYVTAHSAHVVDRNLELAAAAGAANILHSFPLPPGRPEAALPPGEFVLANPLAGWGSKQWPLENYAHLARRIRDEFGLTLVLNGPPSAKPLLESVEGAWPHLTGIPGLICATRGASAVIGLDSGPLHLAAALARPGVALYGPTDPARNGPYGDTITVLRDARASTSYKRRPVPGESMAAIPVDAVFEALKLRLTTHSKSSGTSA